jgi:uncharacterized protein
MARFFQSAVKNTIIFSTALFSAFTFAQGKLAIVIDDIGYHPKEDAEVLAMPKEISVAIIPAAPYAKIRNQEAKKPAKIVEAKKAVTKKEKIKNKTTSA